MSRRYVFHFITLPCPIHEDSFPNSRTTVVTYAAGCFFTGSTIRLACHTKQQSDVRQRQAPYSLRFRRTIILFRHVQYLLTRSVNCDDRRVKLYCPRR